KRLLAYHTGRRSTAFDGATHVFNQSRAQCAAGPVPPAISISGRRQRATVQRPRTDSGEGQISGYGNGSRLEQHGAVAAELTVSVAAPTEGLPSIAQCAAVLAANRNRR